MKNRVHALRTTAEAHLLLPVEFDDEDRLHCRTRREEIIIDARRGSPVAALIQRLVELGIEAHGCFDCVFFAKPGFAGDVNSTVGYCIEGRIGVHVGVADTTSETDSCDVWRGGAPEERQRQKDAWAASLLPWRGE
jgi:hypothetical protein